MEPLLAVMLTVLLWVSRTRGDVRCYCNDAACISTGYMCKSTVGKCFSRLNYDTENTERSLPAQGCVDFLPPDDRSICERERDIIKTSKGPQDWPILRCCNEDMCNYLDISIYVDKNSNGSKGQKLRPGGPGNENQEIGYPYLEETYQQRDLWFKAAVIAVPIAGGFILILLVLLAIRMLRSDSRRHRQLMQMRRHRSLTKAQLYVADHFSEKHERNAHFNAIDIKPNNIYKEVNIKVDYDGHGYEKITDTSGSNHGGSCNSIIVWGKPGKADPPSAV